MVPGIFFPAGLPDDDIRLPFMTCKIPFRAGTKLYGSFDRYIEGTKGDGKAGY